MPGVASATRYRFAPDYGFTSEYRYLAVYELEGDPGAVLAEVQRRAVAGESTPSDSIDSEHVVITTWEPITA